ncbi:PspC domain-containing protein, partial [Micromonospora sp. DH15]|nr:PspC domain-containing protein [Micromonospora sp. DH15]
MTQPPRLYRAPEHRMAAGVAAGIAEHLGISVVRVRIAFMVLLGLSGLGLLLYAAFWAVVPLRPGDAAVPARRDLGQLLPFVAIGLVVLVLQTVLFDSVGAAGTAGWLVAIIAVGAGVIWHQSAPERRRQWDERMPVPWLGAVIEENDRRAFVLRFIGGGVLVAV